MGEAVGGGPFARSTAEAENELREQIAGLRNLELSLLRRYFQLLMLERNVSRWLRPKQRGTECIRQLERERQRLGRELHTGVGQLLAAVRLHLEVIGSQIPDAPPSVHQALARTDQLAAQALDLVRSVSRQLHPPEWQALTLETAVRQMWEMSGVSGKFDAELEIEPLPGEPEFETKVVVYRAAQEALANVIRHSGATRVSMRLQGTAETITLSIKDNGAGFDANALWAAPPDVKSGLGLRAMRDQVESIGGKLEVGSGANGTTLVLRVPVKPID